jgi:hemolysin type calcium-binding protein
VRLPLAVGIVVLAVLGVALAKTPSGEARNNLTIVLRAASSGSHLRLSVSGSQLLVDGYLAQRPPRGCAEVRGRSHAGCDLAGVGSVVIEMGPADDKVEVLDPLPVPLVAYLGGGSDKLIGNEEPDTCYPQGARRNRCIGGGGDDVCVTGPDNTDCVGGAGDDYCRASGGSDGCWGGPGNDVCEMGAGQDGCHGDAGRDRLLGGAGADQLYGGPGRDYCDGAPGVGYSHECEVGWERELRRAPG